MKYFLSSLRSSSKKIPVRMSDLRLFIEATFRRELALFKAEARSISNTKELDSFVKDLGNSDYPKSSKWFVSNFKNYLRDEGDAQLLSKKELEKLSSYPSFSWISKAIESGEEVYKVDLSSIERTYNITNLRDYLYYLELEKPTTNLVRLSVPDAIKQEKEWHDELSKSKKDPLALEDGVDVVMDFGDGFRILDVFGKQSLKNEGDCMGHCAGYEYHYKDVKSGKKKMYSLRDSKNESHATLEVFLPGEEVAQIKGKANKPVVDRYVPYVVKFLKKMNFYKLKESHSDWAPYQDKVIQAFGGWNNPKIWGIVDKSEVAENPDTPKKVLVKLAEDESDWVRGEVAGNPNTPAEVLVKLAEDKESDIRDSVARNPNTPVELLVKLAADEDWWIREEAIKNPNTPAEVLVKLAEDKESDIRDSVARNPNTPVELLVKLAADEHEWVRGGVAGNPNTPKELLVKLASDKEEHIRNGVAKNPNTPAEVLVKLAEDKGKWVRYNIAKNPNTPAEVLVKLAEDKDDGVRRNVARNPNYPR